MLFIETGNEGSLNGVTEVELVPAPAAGRKHISRSVKIHNKDTAIVTVEVFKEKAGTEYRICNIELAVGDTLILDENDIEVLDATDETLEAKMSGAAATINPTWTSSYAIRSA